MRRVHVLGGGSLGSLFLSHFARAGVDPTLLLRPSTARVEGHSCKVRITEEDTMGSSNGVDERSVRCESTSAAGEPFDILVVSTKAFDVSSALEDVRPRLSPSSAVILLCNGALALADEVPTHGGPLMAATSTHGAWSRGKRDVHHAGKGMTWIGAFGVGDHTPVADEAQRFFAGHGLGAEIEDPEATERRLWLKLAANAVLNPLTALWDCQNGEVLARAEGRDVARLVCEEILPVAHRLTRHAWKPSLAELVDFVHECAAANAQNYSSMHQDVRYGRRTEIEQINGWIARKGRELGLAEADSAAESGGGAWHGKNEELAQAIRARHPPSSI